MRVMIKFTFPVDTGNDAIRDGRVKKVFTQIEQELKPEAAYFFPQGGERGGPLSRGHDCVVADRGNRRTVFLWIERKGGDDAGDGPGRSPARLVQH